MRQINLLPSEIAERRRARRMTAILTAAGLGLVAVLVLVFILQGARLSSERSKLEERRRANAQLRQRVGALRQFEQLQAELKNKEQLLGRLTQNEVRWSVLLADISLVIPSDVWLTNFTGSLQAPAAGTQPGGQPAPRAVTGTIQMTGMTFTHLDVAKWLTRLADVKEFLFPYLSLSQKTDLAGHEVVQFNSSVNLSDLSLRRNQRGGGRRP